jgi:hypothetical protein
MMLGGFQFDQTNMYMTIGILAIAIIYQISKRKK